MPLCSKEGYMLYLVYREDTNGVRYLVCSDLSKEAANETLARMTSGRSHKQDYAILSYDIKEKQAVLREHKIVQ
jgi:hypothetical protein